MQQDQLRREVNRLYWQTDAPVTRLSDELGVSRGTFYNHLDPLPAPGKCGSCGAPLFFRTRSNRDAGDAQCEACGSEQTVQPPDAGGGRDARRLRVADGSEASPVEPARTRVRSQRYAFLAEHEDDRMRTRLLAVAVGAAILGVGILYFARRR